MDARRHPRLRRKCIHIVYFGQRRQPCSRIRSKWRTCRPMVFRRVGGYLCRLDIRQGMAADGVQCRRHRNHQHLLPTRGNTGTGSCFIPCDKSYFFLFPSIFLIDVARLSYPSIQLIPTSLSLQVIVEKHCYSLHLSFL